jgi:ABC-type sugar transport system substrate-binding protein
MMPRRAGGGYHDIEAHYEHLIRSGRYKPGQKLPTEMELAAQHGVTRTTIRRAFDGLGRKGLVKKMQGSGTRVAAASEVESRSRARVLIATPASQWGGGETDRPPRCHDMLYQYVESLVAALAGGGRPFQVLYFVEGPGGLDSLLAGARKEGAVGIIATDVHNSDTVDRLAAADVPVIFLDSNTAGRDVDRVKSDNASGARDATRHLLSTTSGPIAFLGNPALRREGNPHKERLDGYLDALREAGREADERYIFGGESPERAEAVERMLRLPQPPGAYMCSDDNMAVDAMECLHRHGVPVPARASVFGFGNLLSGLGAVPPLSTVLVDRRAMGLRAIELLQERLDRPSAPPRCVVAPGSLLLRQTTMPLSQQPPAGT